MSARPQLLRRRNLLLHNIEWKTYLRLLRAFEQQPGYRLAYDRGELEIMSPRLEHDGGSRYIGRMIVVMTEELGLPLKSGGGTTLKRFLAERGIEPDECFWIASEPRIRGRRNLDLRRDPPPDLAVEIDVTHSSLDRLGIYAALRVPELWRLDDHELKFLVLQPDGQYTARATSLTFPMVTPADVIQHIALLARMDENAAIGQFRTWFRVRLRRRNGNGSAKRRSRSE